MDFWYFKNDMNPEQIKKDWESRGHCFGIFKDPPGQIWTNFVQKTDEIVVLAEGEIEIEIEGKSEQPPIGEEVTMILPRRMYKK